MNKEKKKQKQEKKNVKKKQKKKPKKVATVIEHWKRFFSMGISTSVQ